MNTLQPKTRFCARARAKVNLSLEIIRKRKDGYHELETIFQSVDLYDELDIAFDLGGRITITCTDPDIPTDERNICHRAVLRMRPLIGPDLGAAIHIRKRIPAQGGLGGGSADAAAVILAASRASGQPVTADALEGVARELGSDVPFMLYGGTMLGRGRGERLTRLAPLGPCVFLIVKPGLSIPTRDVYDRVNLTLTRHRYRINLKAVNTLLTRFPRASLNFRNALEDVVCPSYPEVAGLLGELSASRPILAAMSGSGSAVFAIYGSEARASEFAGQFSARGFFTAVAEPRPQAIDIFPEETREAGLSKGGA